MHYQIKQILIIFMLLVSVKIVAQNTFDINLSISDTVIIIKKAKMNYKYAIKVNSEIHVNNLQDSLFLYSINKNVPSYFFINDFSIDIFFKYSTGLIYIIEDSKGHIIIPFFEFVSYKKEKDEIKNSNSRLFVSPRLKIERRLLTAQEQREYDLAKYIIHREKQRLELFPLLGEYHSDLPKGEYYLYFVYSYHSRILPVNIADDSRLFRGYFVSNKVKLIVE